MTTCTEGLHEVAGGIDAHLQPDGGWGWSNAGLVMGGSESLLVDTPFDLRVTARVLASMEVGPAHAESDVLAFVRSPGW